MRCSDVVRALDSGSGEARAAVVLAFMQLRRGRRDASSDLHVAALMTPLRPSSKVTSVLDVGLRCEPS
jgi:hypothetical protein